jgi:hypothetical protein
MPPQQSHGLLDGFDKRFCFGAHSYVPRLVNMDIGQVGRCGDR